VFGPINLLGGLVSSDEQPLGAIEIALVLADVSQGTERQDGKIILVAEEFVIISPGLLRQWQRLAKESLVVELVASLAEFVCFSEAAALVVGQARDTFDVPEPNAGVRGAPVLLAVQARPEFELAPR